MLRSCAAVALAAALGQLVAGYGGRLGSKVGDELSGAHPGLCGLLIGGRGREIVYIYTLP